MLIDFDHWVSSFSAAAAETFGGRVVCAGIQGSRARCEAREDSDIDVVLILDNVSSADLDLCRDMISALPDSSLTCGFVSSKQALSHWDEGELAGFYFDTVCCIGSLDFLLPRISREAARRSAHQAACGLYHALCHAAVFESDAPDLTAFAKGVFFLLRAKRYSETGAFPVRLSELLPLAGPAERSLLKQLSARAGAPVSAPNRQTLLSLCEGWILELAAPAPGAV